MDKEYSYLILDPDLSYPFSILGGNPGETLQLGCTKPVNLQD